MIDANKLIDLLKIKMYNEYLYTAHLYDEGESPMHSDLTKFAVSTFIDPLELNKDSVILDIGCGSGYFLDLMKERGYTNLTGVTLSEADAKLCQGKGHRVKMHDMTFLPQTEGFIEESQDMLFVRHALEHSPYPIFTLIEFNRILTHRGLAYIEVPAPDCERGHEFNANHYSILGGTQWFALFQRTGFNIKDSKNFDYEVTDNTGKVSKERSLCFILEKARPIDLK